MSLSVRRVYKAFGGKRVLHDVSLDVPPGSITAIVGPNGSGKTTLNKSILGLVQVDRGEIVVDGIVAGPQADYRGRIGYMPQRACFPEHVTAREVLDLMRALRPMAPHIDASIEDALMLAPFLDTPVRVLSGGQRQRLSATCALLFRPQLLMLDEPTAGLDPVSAAVFKSVVRAARDRGAAVLVTSHILSEVAELADRVVVMLDGQVRYEGALDALSRRDNAASLEEAVLHLLAHRADGVPSGAS